MLNTMVLASLSLTPTNFTLSAALAPRGAARSVPSLRFLQIPTSPSRLPPTSRLFHHNCSSPYALARFTPQAVGDRITVQAAVSSAPPGVSVTDESAVRAFWDWLAERDVFSGGPQSSPVRPCAVPEGLGLVAQRDIPRGEVVMEVPKRLWINPDTVEASEIGPLCRGLKPWAAIALFLLRERGRGEESPWLRYLNILPSSTDSTLFWSDEELLQLQGSQLLNTTLGVKEYIKSEFIKIEEEILLANKQLFPSPITFDDFLWAFGILRSRAFSRLRGENLVLIPLADLINHSPNITTEDTSWEIRGKGLFSRELIFTLRNPASVKAGDQVYIQYDLGKSNAELALDYGLVESRTDRNTYTLTLEIPESDPFYGDKLDIAEINGLGETAYFDIVLGKPLPPTMIPYLRLVALGGSDAFLLEALFRDKIWGHLELPVSQPNEEMICRVMRDACKSALSSYSTTIKEDEELLVRGNLESRIAISVAIRCGEKKVLEQIDRIFQERESELDYLEYYQERRLKDLGLVGEQGEIIFWENK